MLHCWTAFFKADNLAGVTHNSMTVGSLIKRLRQAWNTWSCPLNGRQLKPVNLAKESSTPHTSKLLRQIRPQTMVFATWPKCALVDLSLRYHAHVGSFAPKVTWTPGCDESPPVSILLTTLPRLGKWWYCRLDAPKVFNQNAWAGCFRILMYLLVSDTCICAQLIGRCAKSSPFRFGKARVQGLSTGMR